jgi:hypothetical protein
MNKFLTEADIIKVANLFEIDVRLVKTVLQVEASGKGFDEKTGLIKIQFEPYWFQRYTGIRIANGVENQTKEWIAFKAAEKIDHTSALLSTSFGLMQTMGFNYKACGYKNVDHLLVDYMLGEFYQLKGGLAFITSKPKMYFALKKKDWKTFAFYYNGALYKKFSYDIKLDNAYEKLA